MQLYDLSAIDGVLLGSGLLFYLRPVKPGEAIVGILATATLFVVHWLAPYPIYVAASIMCPFSFVAYLLHSRRGWQRLHLTVGRRSR
jgi:hypothetical protein